MTAKTMGLFKDRPDLTAALRQVAWVYAQERRTFSLREIESRIDAARKEMGLPGLRGGAATTIVQRRTMTSRLR